MQYSACSFHQPTVLISLKPAARNVRMHRGGLVLTDK
jgi:hypothetical protein